MAQLIEAQEVEPYAVFRDAVAIIGSDESIPEQIRYLVLDLVGRPEREQARGLVRAVDALPQAIWEGLCFADRQVVLVARVAAEHIAAPSDQLCDRSGAGLAHRPWTRKLSARGFCPGGSLSTGVAVGIWGP